MPSRRLTTFERYCRTEIIGEDKADTGFTVEKTKQTQVYKALLVRGGPSKQKDRGTLLLCTHLFTHLWAVLR